MGLSWSHLHLLLSYLYRTIYMTGIALRPTHRVTHQILTTGLRRSYCHPCFTGEETEAQGHTAGKKALYFTSTQFSFPPHHPVPSKRTGCLSPDSGTRLGLCQGGGAKGRKGGRRKMGREEGSPKGRHEQHNVSSADL